jgi:hypothetical protein
MCWHPLCSIGIRTEMMMKTKFEIPRWYSPLMFLTLLSAIGCGMQGTSVYNLTQSGAQFSSAQCSTIRLSVNEAGNQISGSGSNPCFNQTLSGTRTANGQVNVTLSLIPVTGGANAFGQQGAGMFGGGMFGGGMSGSSTNCTYQGILMMNGNTIQGTLNPASSFGYGCLGSITINGTRN